MTKYVITDPCYIIPEITWDKACKEIFNDSPDQYENFNKRITKELNDLAGTTNAVASETGYGDWENCMHCSNDNKIIATDFYADSGMVCVVEYNDAIQKALTDNNNDKLIERGGCALIETEGNVEIEINHDDPNWAVIHIEDDNDAFQSLIPTYEDEDDEESWDEEEDE